MGYTLGLSFIFKFRKGSVWGYEIYEIELSFSSLPFNDF